VMAVPVVSRLFAFALPSTGLLLSGLGFVLLGLVWFELVKRIFDSRARKTQALSNVS